MSKKGSRLKKAWTYVFHPIRDYIQFFAKFNVLGLAIGLMIGSNLKDVASVFIDDVIMPFITPLLDIITSGQGVKYTIPGSSITMNLERVLSSGIKFFCLSFIIFIMLQLGVRLKKPIQWVSVRNWNDRNRKRKGKSQYYGETE